MFEEMLGLPWLWGEGDSATQSATGLSHPKPNNHSSILHQARTFPRYLIMILNYDYLFLKTRLGCYRDTIKSAMRHLLAVANLLEGKAKRNRGKNKRKSLSACQLQGGHGPGRTNNPEPASWILLAYFLGS